MLRNIKLQIEYDGSRYLGWQKQSCRPTIQETIEKVLQKILREKVWIIGSGRTDAGVHALAQVANFKTNSNFPLEKLQAASNAHLPDDIVITSVKEVSPDFHSRFCAKSKVYQYLILNRRYPSALLKGRAYFCTFALNLRLMQKEAKVLEGKHDFKAFCASGSKAKDTTRIIRHISIQKSRSIIARRGAFFACCHCEEPANALMAGDEAIPDIIVIEVEANGFLYNMMRNITGTLVEIGRGRFPCGSMKKILSSRSRKLCGPTVPPHGLYLAQVKY